MRIERAKVGAVIVDSLPFSQSGSAAQAGALRNSAVDAVAVYLGVCNAARLGFVLDAGMGCFPVTLAGEYEDGSTDEVAQLKALGFPIGMHVFLDMEGMKAFHTDPVLLISKVNAWADGIRLAGYKPALYVGVPQPLTSDELWALRVELYWKGQGSVRDRKNNLAEPTGCGWSITQAYPSHTRGGTWVDSNQVTHDYKGRSPVWAIL